MKYIISLKFTRSLRIVTLLFRARFSYYSLESNCFHLCLRILLYVHLRPAPAPCGNDAVFNYNLDCIQHDDDDDDTRPTYCAALHIKILCNLRRFFPLVRAPSPIAPFIIEVAYMRRFFFLILLNRERESEREKKNSLELFARVDKSQINTHKKLILFSLST